MFSEAVSKTADYTRPMVISSRTVDGKCDSTIGTYIVLNREGWILTAGHLLEIVRSQQQSARRHRDYQGNVVEFRGDTTTGKRDGKGHRNQRSNTAVSVTIPCGGGTMLQDWLKQSCSRRRMSRSDAWIRSIRTCQRSILCSRIRRGTLCRAAAYASSASRSSG